MLNDITIMGRLTKDPELRQTNSDIAVTTFSIACERDIKNQEGNRDCDFFNCEAWRNTAEFIGKYFKKGNPIAIRGRLKNETFTAKDGTNKTVTKILVESVYFCGQKSDVGQKSDSSGFAQIDDVDGDLPF